MQKTYWLSKIIEEPGYPDSWISEIQYDQVTNYSDIPSFMSVVYGSELFDLSREDKLNSFCVIGAVLDDKMIKEFEKKYQRLSDKGFEVKDFIKNNKSVPKCVKDLKGDLETFMPDIPEDVKLSDNILKG